jgi:V/A-type H+-transporting ATPase subunit F
MDRGALQGTAEHPGGGPLRLRVAVRPGDALGLRLAGAAVEEVGPGDEPAAFRRLLGDVEVGVLAVEATLLAAAPERLLAKAHARGLPVVLAFALPRRWDDADRGRAYVAEIIRRAVGYGVKLTGDAPGGGAP